MTRQGVLLGSLRLRDPPYIQMEIGQILVPKINLFLLVAVLALVLGFRSSDNLGAAYGIAVTGTMSLTTVLALVYTTGVAGWNRLGACVLFGLFLAVDSWRSSAPISSNSSRAGGSRWRWAAGFSSR